MRRRNAGVGRDSERRAHARHDLERHRRPAERLGLLGPPPEEERIAVLEPHDGLAGLRTGDEEPFDRRLVEARGIAVGAADGDHLGVGPRMLEEATADEIVVHDDIGRRKAALAPEGQEARVARASSLGFTPTDR